MKIRKISEDKVQIIITNQDLEERDFKKWELLPLSPKAQELFQDILDMAYEECGFEIEDESQLVVEAYPLSVDSFVVIMTKLHSHYHHGAELLNNIILDNHDDEAFVIDRGEKQVWLFANLEDCSQVCARLEPAYIEDSSLYKYEGKYCLAMHVLPGKQCEVSAITGEYGEWFSLDEAFLKEHGSLLIPRSAVANMASLLK